MEKAKLRERSEEHSGAGGRLLVVFGASGRTFLRLKGAGSLCTSKGSEISHLTLVSVSFKVFVPLSRTRRGQKQAKPTSLNSHYVKGLNHILLQRITAASLTAVCLHSISGSNDANWETSPTSAGFPYFTSASDC